MVWISHLGISTLQIYDGCTFLCVISFLRSRKFSSMILLNIFSVLLSWTSSLSSTLIILRFGLFTGFHISWIFCAKLYLDLMFSLTNESISSAVSSALEILPSLVFCC